MSNYVIEKWFPKSLYIVPDIGLDLDSLETVIKNNIKKTNKTIFQNVNSTHTTNNNLHSLEELAELNQIILKNCQTYLLNLGYKLERLSNLGITNMWANISNKDSYLFPHIHSASMLSGVIYIKSPQASTIKFFDNPSTVLPTADSFNDLNHEYCEYPCKPNSMIIFKSDLLHGNDKQPEGEKIVLSFNAIF